MSLKIHLSLYWGVLKGSKVSVCASPSSTVVDDPEIVTCKTCLRAMKQVLK